MSISKNLQIVEKNIVKTAESCGRDSDTVKLITVTKTIDTPRINEAIEAGATRIGENRAQELVEKIPDLLSVEKHFIGVLQTNKVKYLIGNVSLIHSVDRAELLEEIQRQCIRKKTSMNVLLQVHIGEESSKSGVSPENLFPLVEKTLKMERLTLCGLMTVPPPAVGDEARKSFEKLRYCFEQVKNRYGKECPTFQELSMGMSGDYEEAILEGATYVRVGSAIFGSRIYL